MARVRELEENLDPELEDELDIIEDDDTEVSRLITELEPGRIVEVDIDAVLLAFFEEARPQGYPAAMIDDVIEMRTYLRTWILWANEEA
jgi:hypothetical protein